MKDSPPNCLSNIHVVGQIEEIRKSNIKRRNDQKQIDSAVAIKILKYNQVKAKVFLHKGRFRLLDGFDGVTIRLLNMRVLHQRQE